MEHDANLIDTGIAQRRTLALARAKRSAMAWWAAGAVTMIHVVAGVVLQLSSDFAVTAWPFLAFSLFWLVPCAAYASSAWLQARRTDPPMTHDRGGPD